MLKIFPLVCLSFISITGNSQTIGFTYVNANGGGLCSPATVNFTPVYTGNPIGFTWYFGNGETSNSSIPSVTYTAGTYIVKLVAVFQDVALETTQTIIVAPVFSVGLTANRNYMCQPGNVKFTATSSAPNVSYMYDFGDGTAITTTLSDTITHFFASFGTYNSSVKVINATGCNDSATTIIKVEPFPLQGTLNPGGGCAPANVLFSGIASIPGTSIVDNYQWNFGDGSAIAFSNTASINHTYADSGHLLPRSNSYYPGRLQQHIHI